MSTGRRRPAPIGGVGDGDGDAAGTVGVFLVGGCAKSVVDAGGCFWLPAHSSLENLSYPFTSEHLSLLFFFCC